MCAQTGIPRSANSLVLSASQAPPSSLTTCAPALIKEAALSKDWDSEA